MAKKHAGLFITFEGTEGSGKSTLIQHLEARLKTAGHSVLITREPGGTPLSERIRELILNHDMSALTELFLYEASRSEHVTQKIVPALKDGQIVLCDRFTDSTLAYQSGARGLPWTTVKALNRLACGPVKPHLRVLIDVDIKKGLERASDANRFEREKLEFHHSVKRNYIKAFRESPKTALIVRADDLGPDAFATRVLKQMGKRLKKDWNGI